MTVTWKIDLYGLLHEHGGLISPTTYTLVPQVHVAAYSLLPVGRSSCRVRFLMKPIVIIGWEFYALLEESIYLEGRRETLSYPTEIPRRFVCSFSGGQIILSCAEQVPELARNPTGDVDHVHHRISSGKIGCFWTWKRAYRPDPHLSGSMRCGRPRWCRTGFVPRSRQ